MESRPPFMNGLLTAKSILLSLKERKLGEQRDRGRRRVDENSQEGETSTPKQQKNPSPPAAQPLPCEQRPSRRQQLCQRINQMGGELHSLHLENETYEVIFHRLAEHYLQNHRTVEENEGYKRRGFQLEEQIKDFKQRIRVNYEELEAGERQGAEMQAQMQQALQQFLTNERERALLQPLRSVPVRAQQLLEECKKMSDGKDAEGNEESDGSKEGLTLNWRSLAQKTAKKPAVRRAKPAEEALFHAELYNI